MPIITISYNDLKKLVGKEISLEELSELIMNTKGEIDDVRGDEIAVETTADRIDMLSVEGLARAIKGFLGIERGIPRYEVVKGSLVINVDSSVSEVRPYIVGAVIRNIKLTEDSVAQIMQLQEKLHVSWCRNRKKGSIGIYDLDKIKGPIEYSALEPNKIKFVPLEETKPMTGKEILEEHPKGQMFKHLLIHKRKYPLLVDSQDTVLSMPPIINSEDTKVTPQTKNLFIDVTGDSWRIITYALNVIVSNIAERGAVIETVTVNYSDKSVETPELKTTKIETTKSFIERIVGITLSKEAIVELLLKSRLNAKFIDDDTLEVEIPPYRQDFLHEIDIAEEVAIAYGYNKMMPEMPQLFTIGKEHPIETFSSILRDIMIGNGYQEVRNYVFTNKTILFEKVRRVEKPIVEIENPVSILYSVLRDSLVPEMLEFLSNNTHAAYPQNIFEVGDVVLLDEKAETKTRQERHICAVTSDYSVGFEEIHMALHQFMRTLGLQYKLERDIVPYLIDGRTVKVIVQDKTIGVMGEVHPEVLRNFELTNPVALFELNVTELLELIKKKYNRL